VKVQQLHCGAFLLPAASCALRLLIVCFVRLFVDAAIEMQAEFAALRQAGSAPAMVIATPYDLHTSRW
jgi:hypothetical protein